LKKVLRKIYGAVNDRGIWRVRYNTEIYILYKEPYVINVVEANRLRWLGHLFRTDDNNPCKKVTFNDPFYVKRKIVRPATRWLDDVENDLKTLKVSQWKRKAQERNKWKKIIGAVLTQKGSCTKEEEEEVNI
jgi:hypothetical protein